MRYRTLIVPATAVVCLGLRCPQALGESPAEVFARGQSQIASGKLQQGLKSLAAAVAAEPGNEAYQTRFELVRKACSLQQQLNSEEDAARWTHIARALHIFYHREKLYEDAVQLDREIHKRLQTAVSANLLAQTLMAMGRNWEAAVTLQVIPGEQRDLGSSAMLATALARAGKREQAAEIAEQISIPEQLCPGKAFMLARMRAAMGDEAAAADLLRLAFSVTPATRLPALKSAAQQCPDLGALLKKKPYQDILATVSTAAVQADHDHDDAAGHCANCPSQPQVADLPDKQACEGGCDGCEADGCQQKPQG